MQKSLQNINEQKAVTKSCMVTSLDSQFYWRGMHFAIDFVLLRYWENQVGRSPAETGFVSPPGSKGGCAAWQQLRDGFGVVPCEVS